MLALIAMVIGSVVMVSRHLDDWPRPSSGDQEPLPAHRTIAITMARPFQLLAWKVYDFIHAFGAKTPPDPDVVVLGIDEASLSLKDSSAFPEDVEGSRPLQLMDEVFPWSREAYAHMIEPLVDAGARTVVKQDFHITPVGRIAGVRIHAHVYAAAKAGQLLRSLPR